MLWIELGSVVLALVAVPTVAAFTKRPVRDLGSVSSHWVAAHRTDT